MRIILMPRDNWGDFSIVGLPCVQLFGSSTLGQLAEAFEKDEHWDYVARP